MQILHAISFLAQDFTSSPFLCVKFFLSSPSSMTSISTFVGSRSSVPSTTVPSRWTSGEVSAWKSPRLGCRGRGYPALWAAGLIIRRAMKRGKPMPPDQAEDQPPKKNTKFIGKGIKPKRLVADESFFWVLVYNVYIKTSGCKSAGFVPTRPLRQYIQPKTFVVDVDFATHL